MHLRYYTVVSSALLSPTSCNVEAEGPLLVWGMATTATLGQVSSAWTKGNLYAKPCTPK